MSAVLELMEAAVRHAREGGAAVPEVVLGGLVREAGAQGGVLGKGAQVLARTGAAGPVSRRLELPAGRDSFWLDMVGGIEPPAPVHLAARLALSSWAVREELKLARFAERRRLWEVESLRAIAEVLGGTLEESRIAETLVLHATALLDARRGEVWLEAETGWAPISKVEGAAGSVPCLDGSCVVAARVGGAVLSESEVRAMPDGGLLETGRLAVPLVGRRGRLGAIALADREVRGGLATFSPTDAETLALFASQAAVAFENASLHHEAMERQQLERELELAASVQQELLPTRFDPPAGVEILTRSQPSRRVGGDVCDLLALREGTLLMIGDVAGKGVAAALMASSLQSAVRLLAHRAADLAELATQLHEHLLATTPENKFATIFLACLHGDGVLEYVSAAHNPVVVVDAAGAYELLEPTGPPLGLLPDTTYERKRLQLGPGSLLLAYTDGLSEATSPVSDEEFGVDRLVSAAVEDRRQPLARLVDSIFASVTEHTRGLPAHDDRTVLAVRLHTS